MVRDTPRQQRDILQKRHATTRDLFDDGAHRRPPACLPATEKSSDTDASMSGSPLRIIFHVPLRSKAHVADKGRGTTISVMSLVCILILCPIVPPS